MTCEASAFQVFIFELILYNNKSLKMNYSGDYFSNNFQAPDLILKKFKNENFGTKIHGLSSRSRSMVQNYHLKLI